MRIIYEPRGRALEPLIDPDQALYLIALTYPFVDEYRLGTLNHAEKTLTDEQLADYAGKAHTLLKHYGKKAIWKKDLQPYLRAAGVSG